jgi:hypothetical protein
MPGRFDFLSLHNNGGGWLAAQAIAARQAIAVFLFPF